MRFWDSSAVLPLLVEEEQSGALMALRDEEGPMVVWTLSSVEVQAALARRIREGTLRSPQRRVALTRLAELENHWTEIPLAQEVKRTARRLVHVHPLRAADSLQLAAALQAREETPGLQDVVCLDLCLREAAGEEGFRILP